MLVTLISPLQRCILFFDITSKKDNISSSGVHVPYSVWRCWLECLCLGPGKSGPRQTLFW